MLLPPLIANSIPNISETLTASETVHNTSYDITNIKLERQQVDIKTMQGNFFLMPVFVVFLNLALDFNARITTVKRVIHICYSI